MLKKPIQIEIQFEEAENNLPADETTKPTAEAIASEIVDMPFKTRSKRGRPSLQNSLPRDLPHLPADEVLEKKMYYGISEVAQMFEENISLIRYWENEFDILKPKKNGKGDRLFRPADVKNIALIYDLIKRRKYTIPGAKEYLRAQQKAPERWKAIEALKEIKMFLQALKEDLR